MMCDFDGLIDYELCEVVWHAEVRAWSSLALLLAALLAVAVAGWRTNVDALERVCAQVEEVVDCGRDDPRVLR